MYNYVLNNQSTVYPVYMYVRLSSRIQKHILKWSIF